MEGLDIGKVSHRALKILSEHLVMENILEINGGVNCPGDVAYLILPRRESVLIPLDCPLFANFVVKDSQLGCEFSKLTEWFIKPAMEDLSKEILDVSNGSLKFANLPLANSVECYIARYGQMSMRTIMKYNARDQGVEVDFDILFGTVDLTNCNILKPETPVITTGSREIY